MKFHDRTDITANTFCFAVQYDFEMLAYAKWLAYFSFLPTLQPSEKVCWNKICLEYNSCHKRSRLRSRHFSCCTLHFQVGIDGKSLRLNYVRYTASLKLKNGPHYATIVPLRKSMRTMEENAASFLYERFYFYKNKTNANYNYIEFLHSINSHNFRKVW